MSSTRHEVRSGAYYDSVILMQLQKALAGLPGVEDAGVVMATPANKELLAAAGFDAGAIEARADDLLLMVRAEDEETAAAALAQVDELLARRRSRAASAAFRPRSLASAVQQLPESRWVLVSVPGRYAAGVAEEALAHGRHVFLYSDNVALEDELRLKKKAREQGLLVMGPDCGTAIINGVGLGFANRVRRGSTGLIAASGTGLQAVTAGLHNRGAGISQAIGLGGRDLQEAVGGISALQALDLLARDPETESIVLISKPPSEAVATRLLAAARSSGKPVVVSFQGYAPPARHLGNLHFAAGLADTVELALSLANAAPAGMETRAAGASASAPYLRGLFSGGTLAAEALLALQPLLRPLYSNVGQDPAHQLADPLTSQAHTILDLGADTFTQGRLHPMLDNDLRLRRLRQEAADPEVGVILLDVVLGEGAHPDPAAELASAIAEARAGRSDLKIIAILLGTGEDPQGLDGQREQLTKAGATVHPTTSAAVDHVLRYLPDGEDSDSRFPPLPLEDFRGQLAAINVGLESFFDSLDTQGAKAVHVEWQPPAGGNEKLMSLLAKMKGSP